jgi:hypothetical protein
MSTVGPFQVDIPNRWDECSHLCVGDPFVIEISEVQEVLVY